MKLTGFRFVKRGRRLGHLLALCLPLFPWAVGVPARAGGFEGTPEALAEQASFRVLDGFEVSLFATEREGAIKPIQIRFDADGALWLVGSTTYPQIVPGEVPNDHVIKLEDTDGDGRADRRTLFADGLMVPTGLELGQGGAYVGAATELLHLRDTDGDGRADQRRVLLRGFGTGDAHQTLNTFVWGPSGELMMSQGLHAHSRVETPWGISELRQAGVWRLWPRRLKLEAFWNGAMGAHNPFGTVFDRWGQPLVLAGNGHGIYHLTPAMVATDHFLLQSSLWNQGRKFGGGDFVENAHWPLERQGELISGGYLHNSVERFRVSEAGSTFQIERLPPLVESTNTAFRVVDVRFGPDGALYLCDWHNALIGHYQTSFRDPGRDRTRGRIWRVTAKGRPLVPKRAMSAWSEEDVLGQLRSGDRYQRQMARRVLADRAPERVLPALRAWLRRLPAAESLAWVEGVGVAASHEVMEAEWIERLAASPAFQARAFAMRLAGQWSDRLPEVLTWLERGVADPHPRVRLEALVSCAAVRDVRAVEVALRVVDLPMDSTLEYALTQVVHALKPWWADAHASGTLKLGGRPQYLEALARADASGDTAAIAAGRLRRVGEVALEALEIERLAVQVARSGGSNEISALLETRIFTLGAQYEELLHARSLATLADSAEVRGVRPIGNPAGPLGLAMAGTRRPELRAAAARLAGIWQVTALRDTLRATAIAPDAPVEVRVACAGALASLGEPGDLEVVTQLARAETAPERVRTAALAALAAADLPTAAAAAAGWLSAPRAEPDVTRVLSAFLARREGASALARALVGHPPHTSAASAALALMAGSGRRDPALVSAFEQVRGQHPVAGLGAGEVPALVAEVRRSGDAARGRAVFERAELGCVVCHSVDGTPGKIGPDLSPLGTAQTAEFILGAILDPQREVKEGFMAHELELTDAEVLQGYVRSETEAAVVVWDHLSRSELAIPRSRIASRRQLGTLMPAGLVAGLTREELRDLTAYLAQLGRAK